MWKSGARRRRRICLATVPGLVALQLHAVLLFIDRQPVGSGADGVIGKVLPALLAVVIGDCFPRYRRGEWHGEEIENLWLGFAEHDLELTLAADDDAGDAAGAFVLFVRRQGGEGRIGLAHGGK